MLHFTEILRVNCHGIDVIERVFKNCVHSEFANFSRTEIEKSKKSTVFHNSFVSHQQKFSAQNVFEHDNSEVVYSASSFFKALPERLFGKL